MDVVVVGGGSAGLFCAHGLADHAHVTVVEAGIDPGSPAPARFLDEHLFPDCDWDYTEADRGYHLVRGKVLGGSSTVNASAAVRGQPSCFAEWGTGWSWDDVLPTFRAIERDVQFGGAPWHGDAGPVAITRLSSGAVEDAFDAAARGAGFADCADHNAPGSLGIGPWPTNRVAGGRWGTLPAVAPLLRGRVTVLGGAYVRRLLHRNDKVTGVELEYADGTVERLRADVVVVAGGAFGTPELLARSELATDRVGRELHDHPWISLDVVADPDAICERPVSGALLRYGVGDDPGDEIQVFGFSASIYQPELPPSTYRMSVGVMAPRSRGVLRTDGTRTDIHLGHLADASDTARLADGVRRASELLEAMQTAGAVKVPADAWWHAPDLDAELRARVETYNHPVGTCGIGRVVDARLRLASVEGIRVADASVMPVIPKANTNLTSMMIGARAADFVIEDEF